VFISVKAAHVRKRMAQYMDFLHHRSSELGYAEVRPMRSFPTPFLHVPAHDTDCSESTAIITEASGAPTPYVSNDAGFTGTMLATLPRISLRKSRRGDLVVFVAPERPTGDHVVMLRNGGMFKADPLVWSHGGPGVDVMPLSHMKAGFPGHEAVVLRNVPPRLS
jgi:hypothetical protein